MNEEYDFSQGKRGAVESVSPSKTRITIRLDDDILAWFRALVHERGGGNYQTLINDALRQHIKQERESLEEILRRVFKRRTQAGRKIKSHYSLMRSHNNTSSRSGDRKSRFSNQKAIALPLNNLLYQLSMTMHSSQI